MDRIVILGCGGSGKTVLARRLGARRGLPVTNLDALFYDDRITWVVRPVRPWLPAPHAPASMPSSPSTGRHVQYWRMTSRAQANRFLRQLGSATTRARYGMRQRGEAYASGTGVG